MAKANITIQSFPSQPALAKEEEIAQTISYIKVFDQGVEPKKIADLLTLASRFVIAGNERQAAMLEALKECVSSAQTGKPMRLSPELHQLNVSSLAANICEGIIIHAECEVEHVSATFQRHRLSA